MTAVLFWGLLRLWRLTKKPSYMRESLAQPLQSLDGVIQAGLQLAKAPLDFVPLACDLLALDVRGRQFRFDRCTSLLCLLLFFPRSLQKLFKVQHRCGRTLINFARRRGQQHADEESARGGKGVLLAIRSRRPAWGNGAEASSTSQLPKLQFMVEIAAVRPVAGLAGSIGGHVECLPDLPQAKTIGSMSISTPHI